MKLRRLVILLTLILLFVLPVAATAYEPSTALEARYVPTYIYKEDTVQMLYNPDTAAMAMELSIRAYDIQDGYKESADWLSVMRGYGYEQVYKLENNRALSLGLVPMPNNSKLSVDVQAVNGMVGIQKLFYNGQIKYAVCVAFRGTVPSEAADLLTDAMIIPVEDGVHLGFLGNARDMANNISQNVSFTVDGKTYTMTDIYEEMKEPDSRFCMVVTGHSLGGAIADVFVGHELYGKGVHPSNVVAYTFAAARSVQNAYEYPHTNIFNVINNDDLIPCVGGDKQIGTNLYFTPEDDFRQAHYSKFEAGHSSAWWSNILNNISMGLAPHNRHVYTKIVAEMRENLTDYAKYSTDFIHDITWDDIRMTKDCFGSFSGDIETYAPIHFEGATLCVGGDLLQHHTITMHDHNDFLLVEGNWELEPRMADDAEHLTAGTVELRGNMDVEWLHGGRGYHETGTHRTFLTGDGYQSIRAGSTTHTQFENLYIKNPYVNFELAIRQLKLREDTVIRSTPELQITDTLELNGHTLTVEHPVLEMTLGGENTLSGTMLISGNLTAQKTQTFDKAEVRVTGNAEFEKSLIMRHEEDYLRTYGDFTVDVCDTLPADHLSAGTVEVKGNFTQNGSTAAFGYYETGTHRTVLSGDKVQEVTFRNTTVYNQLENLHVENENVLFHALGRVRLGADAVVTGTEKLVVNRELELNGHTLSLSGSANVERMVVGEGFLDVAGDLHLKNTSIGGQIRVGGNLTTTDPLIWEHASVEVLGDATFDKSLYMQHEDDYLLVHGLCGVDAWNTVTKDHLSAGTVELKGGFETLWHTEGSYWESGSHQTIFSGEDTQNVFIRGTSNCNFANLYLRNPKVSFNSSVPNLILREDTVLTGTQNLRIDRELSLNGHTLTVEHPELTVYLGQAQTLQGDLNLSGDLLMEQALTFDNARVKVSGSCELRDSFTMHHDRDYLLVGGDLELETRENTPTKRLTAGTLEVKGHMNVNYREEYAYYPMGSHRTVFSGTKVQNVNVAGEYNRIENLVAKNGNLNIGYMRYLALGADAAIWATPKLHVDTLKLKGYRLVYGGEVQTKDVETGGSAMVQVGITDGVVTAKGFADKDTPVHVLVTGYRAGGQLVKCQVMTFQNEAEMNQTLDTANWQNCAEIKTMILTDDHAPICRSMAVK